MLPSSTDPSEPRRWNAASRVAFGPTVAGLNVAALAAVVVLVIGAEASAIVGHGRPVLEALVVVAGGTILTGLAATVTWALVWPPRSRRSAEAFVWLGEFDLERGAEIIQAKPTIDNLKRYVRNTPERAQDLWLRVEAHAAMGELEEARAIAERLPDDKPLDRVERTLLRGYTEWLAGGDGGVDELRRAVERVEPVDGDDRLRSEVSLALAEVRALVAAGDPDPIAPFLAVRDRLGERADAVLWLAARRQVAGFLKVAAVGVIVLSLIDRALSAGAPTF